MPLSNPSQLNPNSRVITVTVANLGIGTAIAARLPADGDSLSLAARDPSGTLETASDKCLNCHFDAWGLESLQAWGTETQRSVGRIDSLVNNALIFPVPVYALRGHHSHLEQRRRSELTRLIN